MEKDPEYLCINPVFNVLKRDVMTNHEIVLEPDFLGQPIMIRRKIPIKLYLITRNKDMTNIKNYRMNYFFNNLQ